MPPIPESPEPVEAEQAAPSEESAFARARDAMVASQIIARGVKDPGTLAALRETPRHLFVSPGLSSEAYADHPLPIGHGQTISQPYIVAFMTEALGFRGGETVLEVGSGCGYQSAVLARIAKRAFGIEIVEPLARESKDRLMRLGYENVEIRFGDGYLGWPEQAPFDAIMVSAAAPRVPEPLKQQLRDGGRLILPVGDYVQQLRIVTRRGSRFEDRNVLAVQFVPMTGEIRKD